MHPKKSLTSLKAILRSATFTKDDRLTNYSSLGWNISYFYCCTFLLNPCLNFYI